MKHAEGSVKDTIISMVISLAMALVAKAYVIEAFVIPTGSMAPTLLGQHMEFTSPQSGVTWAVNPWYYDSSGNPFGLQGGPNVPDPTVTDPMTVSRVAYERLRSGGRSPDGWDVGGESVRVRAGDRILVQKFLYEVFGPERYDVVVFKNPENASENFIKRLVGLPGEELLLADGDVFVRLLDWSGGDGEGEAASGWAIAPKPVGVQERLWRTVFSTEYTPLAPVDRTGRSWFRSPWGGVGWEAEGRGALVHGGASGAGGGYTLVWDSSGWPITDWEPYNDVRNAQLMPPRPQFPVADVRVRGGVEPMGEGLTASIEVAGRGHHWRAVLGADRTALEMKAAGDGSWEVLAETAEPMELEAGVVTDVEFWHWDQRVRLVLGGEEVLSAGYGWSPTERLGYATTVSAADLGVNDRALADPRAYRPSLASLGWAFQGPGVRLHRVGVDRDIWYQPAVYLAGPEKGLAALGTHPEKTVRLREDQYFTLGDNSASSKDGRLWDRLDPVVERDVDPTMGVVNDDLMLGKAFFVYFPAPRWMGRIPVPDFGGMRFIW